MVLFNFEILAQVAHTLALDPFALQQSGVVCDLDHPDYKAYLLRGHRQIDVPAHQYEPKMEPGDPS